MPDSAFDFAAKVAEGFAFTPPGIEWNVITPAGRHGAGPTPEEALLNVDSQLLYVEGRRVLVRANGDQITLDHGTLAEAPPEPAPEVAPEPTSAKRSRRAK